jgi:hypothetical protein
MKTLGITTTKHDARSSKQKTHNMPNDGRSSILSKHAGGITNATTTHRIVANTPPLPPGLARAPPPPLFGAPPPLVRALPPPPPLVGAPPVHH